MIVFSQEYSKYVTKPSPLAGGKNFHFKISRAKTATFLIIRYNCEYAVIPIPALQKESNYIGRPIRTQEAHSLTLDA